MQVFQPNPHSVILLYFQTLAPPSGSLCNTRRAIPFASGCIPCKTYAEGTPIPKLSYARYFQGKRAAKNLSNDDFNKL